MSNIKRTAARFFSACEAGEGWAGCREFCTTGATFDSQAEPLADVRTLEGYADWMKGLMTVLTDGTYDLKSFAVDDERGNVSAYAVFKGTHLAGGPVPPTHKTVLTDYVYVMQFSGDKISHMTKIRNSGNALKQLGWA
ncbi:MAG: nuclear transport factor 2 family protein [Proteobacteria bacterium]|nr:nuclear transport factor 2 family protein [Pseudomonadota bacterium]